ncbi:hypothetical protein M427DRAFT_104724, partial [Gonapodya prolifera JEL478]
RKEFLCDICGKAFQTGGYLARHKKVHTADRPHTCPIPGCPSRFNRHDNSALFYFRFFCFFLVLCKSHRGLLCAPRLDIVTPGASHQHSLQSPQPPQPTHPNPSPRITPHPPQCSNTGAHTRAGSATYLAYRARPLPGWWSTWPGLRRLRARI